MRFKEPKAMRQLLALASNPELWVPTTTGALTAFLSLLYFFLVSHLVDTDEFARFIQIISISAMIQIAFIPQSWAFILGAYSIEQLNMRATTSFLIEMACSLIGLMFAVTISVLTDYNWELIFCYIALSMAGSTIARGTLRWRCAWLGYAIYTMLPSTLRLLITLAALYYGSFSQNPFTLLMVVFFTYLLPELVRFSSVTFPAFVKHYVSFSFCNLTLSFRGLFRNWIFDVSSGVTQVADQFFVSIIVSPTNLVIYFFGRRIANITTFILEPYYTMRFRNIVKSQPIAPQIVPVWLKGQAIGIFSGSVIALCLMVYSLAQAHFPDQDFAALPVLSAGVVSAIVLLDSLSAANRWLRFPVLVLNGSYWLAAVRMGSLSVFFLILLFINDADGLQSLLFSFACYIALEVVGTVLLSVHLVSRHKEP